jgi:hypothetical protein
VAGNQAPRTHCLRCGAALDVDPNDARDRRCPRCNTPHVRQDLSPDKFPMTLTLYSGTTGAAVWSRTVTLDEARTLAKIEIPSFADSEHYPVCVECTFADGTTNVGGMS